MRRTLMLVAYDVRAPKRLARVRKSATAWAHGGQRSVLECWARSRDAGALETHVADALRLEEDSLAVIQLGRAPRVIALGIARPPEDRPLLYVS